MAETGEDTGHAVGPATDLGATDDPQLASLGEATGLEGRALDELAGRLSRVKQIKARG